MPYVRRQAESRVQIMETIDIVITMGGLGSRFRNAGYHMPKYMIEVKGKTLFDWSMISLDGYRDIADRYIFIAMKDKEYDAEQFIHEHCSKFGIVNYKVIMLDYLTDGQATTAMLAQRYWEEKHGLLIYNIDTYVEAGAMNAGQLKGDGFIPCFHAKGEHWSFVRLDDDGKVVEIKEKVRISDNCTLGAYYFKTCQLYRTLYEEFYQQNRCGECKEKYVAPLYQYLLEKGGEIFICNVDEQKVHVLGTPEELEELKK